MGNIKRNIVFHTSISVQCYEGTPWYRSFGKLLYPGVGTAGRCSNCDQRLGRSANTFHRAKTLRSRVISALVGNQNWVSAGTAVIDFPDEVLRHAKANVRRWIEWFYNSLPPPLRIACPSWAISMIVLIWRFRLGQLLHGVVF